MELGSAISEGYEAYILFVVQMENVKYFTPNDNIPNFKEALVWGQNAGIKILCVDCHIEPDSITYNNNVRVVL